MDSHEVEHLIEALEKKDPSVRYEAALALEAIGVPVVSSLIELSKSTNRESRFAAHLILRKIGDSEVLPRKILAAAQLTARERIDLLEALRKVRYRDRFMDPPSNFSFSDTRALCETVIGEEDMEALAGAQTVLNWMIKDHALLLPSSLDAANSRDLLRTAQGDASETQSETLLRGASKPQANAE